MPRTRLSADRRLAEDRQAEDPAVELRRKRIRLERKLARRRKRLARLQARVELLERGERAPPTPVDIRVDAWAMTCLQRRGAVCEQRPHRPLTRARARRSACQRGQPRESRAGPDGEEPEPHPHSGDARTPEGCRTSGLQGLRSRAHPHAMRSRTTFQQHPPRDPDVRVALPPCIRRASGRPAARPR
jgi:hypothetical protein